MKIKLQITAFAALIALSSTASAGFFDGMNNGGGNGQTNGTGNGYGTANSNMTSAGNANTQGWGKSQGSADGEVDFTITIKGKGRSDMVSDMFAQANGNTANTMDGNTMGAANATGNGSGNGNSSGNASGNGSPSNWGNNNSGGAYPMMPMRAPAPIMMQQAAPAAGVYPTPEQWQQFLAVQKARQQAFAEIVKRMYARNPAQQAAAPAVAVKVEAPKAAVAAPAVAPK